MEMKTKLVLVGGVFLILVLIVLFLNGSLTANAIEDISVSTSDFVSCLNDKGVVMYGFKDNPSVGAQLSLFGAYSKNVTLIDCHITPEKCSAVIIYPSWKVNGQIISSGLSLGMLSDLSGCKL